MLKHYGYTYLLTPMLNISLPDPTDRHPFFRLTLKSLPCLPLTCSSGKKIKQQVITESGKDPVNIGSLSKVSMSHGPSSLIPISQSLCLWSPV